MKTLHRFLGVRRVEI